jgi:hypothetical protein
VTIYFFLRSSLHGILYTYTGFYEPEIHRYIPFSSLLIFLLVAIPFSFLPPSNLYSIYIQTVCVNIAKMYPCKTKGNISGNGNFYIGIRFCCYT